LAGLPPLEFQAEMYANVYWRVRELREEGQLQAFSIKVLKLVKHQARRPMLEKWANWLTQPGQVSPRVVEIVQLRLADWLNRGWGGLSFYATQMITGHGCFTITAICVALDASTRCIVSSAPRTKIRRNTL